MEKSKFSTCITVFQPTSATQPGSACQPLARLDGLVGAPKDLKRTFPPFFGSPDHLQTLWKRFGKIEFFTLTTGFLSDGSSNELLTKLAIFSTRLLITQNRPKYELLRYFVNLWGCRTPRGPPHGSEMLWEHWRVERSRLEQKYLIFNLFFNPEKF